MPTVANPGVPLAHYREHRGSVILECLDCMGYRRFDLEAVISRLAARGVGGEGTGIRAVASFVRAPCPRCGGSRFESRPYFPGAPKDAGWRSPEPLNVA